MIWHEAIRNQLDQCCREILLILPEKEPEVLFFPEYPLLVIAPIVEVVEMIRKDLDGSRLHVPPIGELVTYVRSPTSLLANLGQMSDF